jgi:EmrB/QacA subfamily drug resistance transporter
MLRSSTRVRSSDGVVMAVATAAAVLVVANVATLNVALPQLSTSLGASQTELQWMVDAYAVVLASLLLPFGAIGDRFGRRTIMLAGLTILCVTNGLTPLADSPRAVIIARALSGVGAALVFPATLSTITASLAPERRQRGISIWTAAVGTGGTLGILGAGASIEHFWWGSVFVMMAALSAAVLAAAVIAVPDTSDPEAAHLDPLGAVLSLVSVGALVLAIIEGPSRGWTSTITVAGFVVAAAAIAAFVRWELRTPMPLLDVRLFANRGVRSGSLSIFVQFISAFGLVFVAVTYLAFARRFGPLDIGLALFPAGIGMVPAALLGVPLSRRFSRRSIGVTGLLIIAAACALGTRIQPGSSMVLFVFVLVVLGAGIGLAGPPATSAIVEALPAAKQGVASALNDVLRELGAALGIAVAGAVFNDGYRRAIDTAARVPESARTAVRDAPAAAQQLAPTLGDKGDGLLDEVASAVIHGWHSSMWTLAAVVLVGAAGFFIWSPGRAEVRQPTRAADVAL